MQLGAGDHHLGHLQHEVLANRIGRRIRIFRMPDANDQRLLSFERAIPLKTAGDNALYVCITQEDGHLIWSSPIYVFR